MPEEVDSCLTCRNALLGETTYCPIFDEVIVNDERAAEDCPEYDPE